MADTEIAQPRTGWGGHIWTAIISAVMGSLAPYIFGAALAAQFSLHRPAENLASDYLFTTIAFAKAFRLALAPLFWSGIVLWFVGCTLQLRRKQLPWPMWSLWGAVTLAVSYLVWVTVLFPETGIGRHAILVSDPLSVDTVIGTAVSAVVGAIVGLLLFVLSPKWPTSALKPSGSS